jgi:hypothetical protein
MCLRRRLVCIKQAVDAAQITRVITKVWDLCAAELGIAAVPKLSRSPVDSASGSAQLWSCSWWNRTKSWN